MPTIWEKILKKGYRAWRRRLQPPKESPSQTVPPIPPVNSVIDNQPVDNQLLRHKNVLITGAGKNIGRAIALEMARQGANVFFTNTDAATCDQLQQELNAFSITSAGYVSDVANIDDVDALCQTLHKDAGTIDIVVNNVGIQFEAIGLLQSTRDQWKATFDTNVIGPMYLSQQMAKAMIQQNVRGSFLFVTSIHQFTISRWPSYSASKAALGMAIQELAVELAAYGIRVNGIAPGWVAEDAHGMPRPHPYTPLGQQSIHPVYIGRAAVYLAADYFSQGTTGAVLTIDGGLSLYNARVAQCPPKVMRHDDQA
ncbi:MAG TPA: SDR family oxidoreductase [Chroococcidiopsis sp.]